MNKPISYLQTDPQWAYNDYSTSGEQTNIAESGCGPTCMAMVIATLKDAAVTPAMTAAWSLSNGYKARNQGTYYSYFKPQGEVYGIEAYQLNYNNLRNAGTGGKITHNEALAEVQNGNYVICCMGKGNWTSSGHFILWYGVSGNTAYINDPNSTKLGRTQGSLALLQKEVMYYFIVKVPKVIVEDPTTKATELATKVASIIQIHDMPALIAELKLRYNGSCWWIIKQLVASDFTGKTAINGKEDIYRRTIAAIKISDKPAFNTELMYMGKSSMFYTIRGLLDKLGVE